MLNRLCTSLHVCHSFTVSTEINKEQEEEAEEKKESEFSRLSSVDMYAACFAVSSGQYWCSRGQTESHAEFLLTVSSFSPCILRLIKVHCHIWYSVGEGMSSRAYSSRGALF